jgi:hypothetical protein
MNKDIEYTDTNEKQKNEQDKYNSKQLNQDNEPKPSEIKKGFKFLINYKNTYFILLFFKNTDIENADSITLENKN